MKTIRNNVFETNSSSCHVLTIMDEHEVEMLKNNEALIYVPDYSSDDDMVADSTVVTEDYILKLCRDNGIDTTDNRISLYIDHVLDTHELDYYNFCDEMGIDDKNIEDALYNVDDILSSCLHNESIDEILNCAKVKEINGTKVYVSVWEKYC